jgi:hypothetical protein
VPAGKHHILCRYEPGNWKLLMAGAGIVLTLLLIAAERRWGPVRLLTGQK